MDGDMIGLVAVIMIFGFRLAECTPTIACKLRSQERLAALPRRQCAMQAELAPAAHSRRSES
jgi:hypothetical protein